MLDARAVEALTGWRVVSRRVVASTNDEAAALLAQGARERVAVVAERQTAGRGRGGSRFASPPGGLYVSCLVRVAPAWLPAGVVAAAGVALAEAVEEVAPGVVCRLKWPNDLWIDGKKAAGLLAEAPADPAPAPEIDDHVPVVVGVGVNVEGVPKGLAPDVAAATTALDLHAEAPVSREALLGAFLVRLDARLRALDDAAGLGALERDYRARLALVGERVRCLVGDVPRSGRLVDASLARGLGLEGAGGSVEWLPAAHVRELRAEPGPA